MQLDRPKINLLIGGMVILAFFLSIIFAAKPVDLSKVARNETRRNHMQVLMTAIYYYAVEHGGILPNCVPKVGQPAVNISECYEELEPYLMNLALKDPDSNYNYMIESLSGGTVTGVKIFSTSPEAKNLEIIR